MQNLTEIEKAKLLLESLYDQIYEIGKSWDDCEYESFSEDECEDCRAELEAEIEGLRRQYDDCREYLVSWGAWES